MAASKPNDWRKDAAPGAPCIVQIHSHAAASWLVSKLTHVLHMIAEKFRLRKRTAWQDTFLRPTCGKREAKSFGMLKSKSNGVGGFPVDMLAATSICMA